MEASSTGQHNGDDPPSRREPVEKQRTDEELAIIYAAMMEELGIGRKDALPLEDKGPQVQFKPIKKSVDDDPNDPTAKWRNIQFDDIDPAEAQLDSMYDGQLYRLRRGNSGNLHHQSSPGRGGGASRGDHSFTNGRGGSSRGGQGPGNKGPRTEPASAKPQYTSPTLKTFFNDARRCGNNNARIDAAVARLRALPGPETIAAQQKGKAEKGRQSAANALSSKRPRAPAIMPRFALARQSACAGFNKPTPPNPTPLWTAVREPSLSSSPSVTSREGHEAPLGPAKIRHPQTSRSADNGAAILDQLQIQRNVQEEENSTIHSILPSKKNKPTNLQNGEVGLSGSRWASTSEPVAFVARTPSIIATPLSPPPELPANKLAVSCRSVLRENVVKVSKGRGGPIRGMARLMKKNSRDTYFTLELEINGKLILNAEVLDTDAWKCDGTLVTYKAKRVEDESEPLPSTTWSIQFQVPYQAMSFYNLVICNLNNRGNQPPSRKEAQTTGNPALATANQLKSLFEKSVPVTSLSAHVSSHLSEVQLPNVRESSSLNATEQPRAFIKNVQPNQQVASAANKVSPSLAAPNFESDQKSIFDSHPIPQQEPMMTSSSHQRITSQDWHFHQISEPHLAGFLDRYQPGATHRISSQSLTDMIEVAGLEPLISFDNDEPVPIEARAFLDLDDTDIVQDTFEHFQNKPEGPFLDQLSNIVAKDNILPASQLTATEILSSPKYQEAAENLVGAHLCVSETFAMLPDLISIHYTAEKSRKILEKAVLLREQPNVMNNSAASQPSQGIQKLENRQNESQSQAETFDGYRLEQLEMTDTTENLKAVPCRPTYSSEDLLSLRTNAAIFRSELISNEVAHHVVRYEADRRPNNPANDIGEPKNGLPIVAGRSDIARQSPGSNTGDRNVKPATMVGAWQAYCVAESEAEPKSSIETQARAVTTQTPAVQMVPSPDSSAPSSVVRNGPVISPDKRSSISHTQETDIALWGPLFTSVRDKEQEPSRIRPLLNNSKPPAPRDSSRGLHLNTETGDHPSIPKPQLNAVSEMYKADFRPSPRSGSSLALNKQIHTALQLPMPMPSLLHAVTATAEPRSPSETQGVTDSISLNASGAIQSTPTLRSTKPAPAPKVEVKISKTAQLSREIHSTTIPPPIQPFPPEPSAKVESPNNKFLSTHLPFPGMAQPASLIHEVETKDLKQTESEPVQVSIPENPNLIAPKVMAKNLQASEIVSATPQIPEMALPCLENVTNKDLKGVPGLAASKWSSKAINRTFNPRASLSGGRPPTISPIPTFNPIAPIYGPYNYAYAPQLSVGDILASPPPIHAMIASTPPLQTVLVPDLICSGHFVEVTGIPASQVAQPMPPMMSPPRKQGDVPCTLQNSPATNFATRSDVNRGHKSNDSPGSDLNYTPSGTPFKSSRGRSDSAANPQNRAALSPIRKGENVQAKLQSRLNNSLAGRSPNAC